MPAIAQEMGRTLAVEEPFGWDEIVECIRENTEESLGKLGRSAEGTQNYRVVRAKLLEEYATLVDIIKIRTLNFDFVLNEDGKKEAVETPPPNPTALVINDFPYNFKSGIEHFVLWNVRAMSSEEIDKALELHTKKWEVAWFHNPPSLQSIPGLWHIHVVSRKKSPS
ncbi:hypothetical protein BSKO_06529 [Bryopsis sp. KO-2023]|nr:hypothetical protein BSKO_06529 [Bryopsis sp. KO-2023]